MSETMRVLIAARLSKKQRTGEDGIGLDTQDLKSRAFCDREGHEVVGITRDTISGSKAPLDRKELGDWIKNKLPLFDAIVAYKTDRLSRGEDTDWSDIESWANKNGKRLIIVGPDGGIQYPSRNDSDYWQWSAFKRQAGNELKDIKERTKRGLDAIRAGGGFIGREPWGYASVGEYRFHYLTPTDAGRYFIPEIFGRIIQGDSLETVAAWLRLMHAGCFNPAGPHVCASPWWPRTVSSMVHNTVYMGHQTDEAGAIVHKCEPLVTSVVSDQAQQALSEREARGPMSNESKALLQGAVFCADCGSPVYRIDCGTRRKDGVKPHSYYYRCAGRGAQRRGCGVMVKLDRVESAFWDIANYRLDVPVIVSEYVPGHNWDSEVKEAEFRLSRLGLQGLSEDEEDAMRAALRAERDELKSRPAEEGHWESTELMDTYLEHLAYTPNHQRGRWLADHDIKVYLSKSQLTFVMPNGDAHTHAF